MHIATTKFDRIKEIRAFTDGNLNFLAAIVQQENDGKLAIWSLDKLDNWDKDLEQIKPCSTIKCRLGRLTCLAIQSFVLKDPTKKK